MTSSKAPVRNPYAKPRPAATAAIFNQPKQQSVSTTMGRQSQQRVNQTKRQFRHAASSKKKRKGDQLTLAGERAFEAERDCVVCHARSIRDGGTPNCRVPNRSHHVLCIKNTTTHGKGNLTQQNIANSMEEKQLKAHFSAPLTAEEKGSGRHLTAETLQTFLGPRPSVKKTPPQPPQLAVMEKESSTTGIDFQKSIATMLADSDFCGRHKNKSAPLAMIAFADEVAEKIIRPKDGVMFDTYFDGLTMVVPPCDSQHENPEHHSIVGQKLMLVDWIQTCGIAVPCPDANCLGELKNTRHNFCLLYTSPSPRD